MAVWKLEPSFKKSLYERTYVRKGDNVLMVETGWRWGEFHVTTEGDEPPVLEEGVDLFNCEYEVEMVECTDGCWEDHDYSECDDETREWLEEFFENGNSWFDLEEEGWLFDDSEMILDCEPTITLLEE